MTHVCPAVFGLVFQNRTEVLLGPNPRTGEILCADVAASDTSPQPLETEETP
ncbi:MAG TPA: hypothetical protein VK427_22850 [Kofleriaceae bacterium]|nr:hypothetical protein [Kofleriaceae bacterium]